VNTPPTCAHPSYEGFVAKTFQYLRELVGHSFTLATIPPDPEAVIHWRAKQPGNSTRYAVVNIGRNPDDTGMIPYMLRFCDLNGNTESRENAKVFYNIIPLALTLLCIGE